MTSAKTSVETTPSCYAPQLNGISGNKLLTGSKGIPITNDAQMMDILSTPRTYRCWLIVNRGWNPTSGYGGRGPVGGIMELYGGHTATFLAPHDRSRYFENYCGYSGLKWAQFEGKPEPKGLRAWLLTVGLEGVMTQEPWRCPP